MDVEELGTLEERDFAHIKEPTVPLAQINATLRRNFMKSNGCEVVYRTKRNAMVVLSLKRFWFSSSKC